MDSFLRINVEIKSFSEDLDLGWCINVLASTGCITTLVSKCPNLKKLFLTAHRQTSDADIESIALLGTYLYSIGICLANFANILSKISFTKFVRPHYSASGSTLFASLLLFKFLFKSILSSILSFF